MASAGSTRVLSIFGEKQIQDATIRLGLCNAHGDNGKDSNALLRFRVGERNVGN